MKFNKLYLGIVFVVLNSFVMLNLCANQAQKLNMKAYKGKKITSTYMTLLNGVMVKFPSTALRMAMAAERGQVVVNHIEKLKAMRAFENDKGMVLGISKKSGEVTYLETSEQVQEYIKKQLGEVIEAREQEYVKRQLEYVLEPVEKFMENIKEHRNIVKNLLNDSLGTDKTKNSYIYTSLEVEGSFLKYFSTTIKTVSELYAAASEFLMFFADVNESLSPAAKESMDKLVEKMRANKKQAANNKK